MQRITLCCIETGMPTSAPLRLQQNDKKRKKQAAHPVKGRSGSNCAAAAAAYLGTDANALSAYLHHFPQITWKRLAWTARIAGLAAPVKRNLGLLGC